MSHHIGRAYDNSQSSDIFWPTLAFDRPTKFDQTNLLYIINGKVNKFTTGKQMSGQFSTLIICICTDRVGQVLTICMCTYVMEIRQIYLDNRIIDLK